MDTPVADDTLNAQLTEPVQLKTWSYFAKGAVVGPVHEDELLLATERGDISLDTLVYTDEFGPDTPENWKQLGVTELTDKVSKVMDISNTLSRDVADVASDASTHIASKSQQDKLKKTEEEIADNQALQSPPQPQDLQQPLLFPKDTIDRTIGMWAAILLGGPIALHIVSGGSGSGEGAMAGSAVFGLPILLGIVAQLKRGRTGVAWALISFIVILIAYLLTAASHTADMSYGISGALLFGALPMGIIIWTLPDRR